MDAELQDAAAEAFAAALRDLRMRAGMTLRELGRRALYDYTRISRAERGEILIPEDKVRAIDDVLSGHGLLVTLRHDAGTAALAMAGHCSVTGSSPVILNIRLPGGGSITVRLSRRQFTQLLTTGLLGAALPGAVTPDDANRAARAVAEPARVDSEVLGYFRRALSEYYSADKMLGPRRLIGPVLDQVEVLDDMRRAAHPGTAGPVLRILAQYGEMAGWLLQDSGSLDDAAHWSRQAWEWATCAGDSNMAAYMLVRQANIAILADDPAAVVGLSAAARRTPGPVDPKLTALAMQQEARGHARLGSHHDCLALLDQAAETLRDHPDVTEQDVPDYLHNYGLPALTEQSAGCYQVTGHADTAVTILEQAISGTSRSHARDRGHLTAKLAVAITRTRDPDPARATTLGLQALAIARETGSARITREVQTLDMLMSSRWPGHPSSREVHDALAV